jgi:hypothetical protein
MLLLSPLQIMFVIYYKNITSASHIFPNPHFTNTLPSHTDYCITIAAEKAVLNEGKQ